MSDENIQIQINEINRKLDLILEDRAIQKQNHDAVVDLVNDLSIVGKDAFRGVVDDLDNAGIELNGDEVKHLILTLLRNIGNINMLLMTLENVTDLVKDASPIIKQVGIDAVDKFNYLDQKGYFAFMKEFGRIIENIMANYSVDDVRLLSDNVVTIMDTVKNLTQPEMLKSVDNALRVFATIEMDEIPPYSVFKVMRELNKPEMKRALGFFVTFMKNVGQQN